jgi:hypothetical protein
MNGLTEAAIVAMVPGIVELTKRMGLPTRFAGVAAIVTATVLTALRDLRVDGGGPGSLAQWLLGGLTLGLAAAGLYSQTRQLPGFAVDQDASSSSSSS